MHLHFALKVTFTLIAVHNLMIVCVAVAKYNVTAWATKQLTLISSNSRLSIYRHISIDVAHFSHEIDHTLFCFLVHRSNISLEKWWTTKLIFNTTTCKKYKTKNTIKFPKYRIYHTYLTKIIECTTEPVLNFLKMIIINKSQFRESINQTRKIGASIPGAFFKKKLKLYKNFVCCEQKRNRFVVYSEVECNSG